MIARMTTGVVCLICLTMVVGALGLWQHATGVFPHVARPEVMTWSVRCAAVSLGALAQVVLLGVVLDRAYGTERGGAVVQWLAGMVGAVATVSAVALGLAGW